MNMSNEHVIKQFCKQRNHRYNTIKSYKVILESYSKYYNKSLKELLKEAEIEEENAIRWKNRKLKKRLTEYRLHYIKITQRRQQNYTLVE